MAEPSTRPTIWKPVLTVFVIALAAYLIYYGSRLIQVQAVHQVLATVFGTVYFVSIFFGGLYIYTDCYVRSVPLGRRILATALIPLLWMTKDVIVMTQSHPILESLYWYFNPLSVWMACLLAMEMGAGTLIGRAILRRRGEDIRIVTPGPIAAIVIGGAIFGGIFAWGQGENLYALYLDVYRLFFGHGT
jgi:hypothetical protein